MTPLSSIVLLPLPFLLTAIGGVSESNALWSLVIIRFLIGVTILPYVLLAYTMEKNGFIHSVKYGAKLMRGNLLSAFSGSIVFCALPFVTCLLHAVFVSSRVINIIFTFAYSLLLAPWCISFLLVQYQNLKLKKQLSLTREHSEKPEDKAEYIPG